VSSVDSRAQVFKVRPHDIIRAKGFVGGVPFVGELPIGRYRIVENDSHQPLVVVVPASQEIPEDGIDAKRALKSGQVYYADPECLPWPEGKSDPTDELRDSIGAARNLIEVARRRLTENSSVSTWHAKQDLESAASQLDAVWSLLNNPSA
jgi:hypothetical protein